MVGELYTGRIRNEELGMRNSRPFHAEEKK
jgi:hypothetical protein